MITKKEKEIEKLRFDIPDYVYDNTKENERKKKNR